MEDGTGRGLIPASRQGSPGGRSWTPGVPARLTSRDLVATTAGAERKPAAWIVRRVSALLSHYFRPGDADAVRAVAERDWVIALADLPGWAVERACDEAALESLSRPTPAAVRKATLKLVEPYGAELTKRKAAAEEAEAERQRRLPSPERRAEIARELGLAVKTMPKGGAE